MNTKYKILNTKYTSGGQAMLILVIFFSFISVSLILGIASPVVKEFHTAKNLLYSKQSYYLAESGIEDGLYRLKSAKQIDASETLILGDSSVVTTLTTLSSSQKKLESLSDVYNRDRKIELVVNAGVGASFNYGIQTGNGGLIMGNGSEVDGNVYSNGSIVGGPGATITGSAYSANSSALIADLENGTGVPINFQNFANSASTQDFAQSFEVSTSSDPLSKFEFYLKKTGNPSNCSLDVVGDNSNSPGSTVYASGTLNASSVGTSYAWIPVSLSYTPSLTAGVRYWVVIDCNSNASRYYTIGMDSSLGNHKVKVGQSGSWNDTSPSGLDSFFKVYLGGINGLIDGMIVGGNAHAHTIEDSNVAGTLYCQVGTTNGVDPCVAGLDDPVQIDFPISDGNVIGWKAEAESGGIYNGNYLINSGTATLGPIKINGNLIVENNSTLNMNGTIWVTGDVTFNNGVNVYLAPGYGSGSGAIVSDGEVEITNTVEFHGSGATDSFTLMLTTSNSSNAINLGNNAGAVILYAQNGTINISNNAKAKEAVGYQLVLSPNVEIEYDTGLVNVNFISGPGGAWNITKWKEVES